MLYLKITSIGEVAFENLMNMEEGYRCDIPFDHLMLPCIPIAEIRVINRYGYSENDTLLLRDYRIAVVS